MGGESIKPIRKRIHVYFLMDTYRNRRKRLNLRFNLLAGIYNLDWVKDKQLNWLKNDL